MKNLFFATITIILLSTTYTQAQDDSHGHELNLGIGILSTANLTFGFADMFVQSISQTVGEEVVFSKKTASPVFHVNYKYWFGTHLALGATLAAGTDNSDFTQKTHNGVVIDTGEMNRFIATLAPEITFNYLNLRRFKLYGLAGIGCSYYKIDVNYDKADDKSSDRFLFDFQLTPIGLKFGNHFGGFAEAGFGYKGIIGIGLFAKW
ncbi:MAG: hypothetical protein LBR55_07645 [Bacteroidales bacterium]|jgi:hypothetical protein|nr:hypothetical protein [Bacteroidales bacterium]